MDMNGHFWHFDPSAPTAAQPTLQLYFATHDGILCEGHCSTGLGRYYDLVSQRSRKFGKFSHLECVHICVQDHADLFRSESRTFAEILALFADGDAFSTALTPAVLCLESCGQYRDYPDTTVKPSLAEVELDFNPKAGPLVLHGQKLPPSQPSI